MQLETEKLFLAIHMNTTALVEIETKISYDRKNKKKKTRNYLYVYKRKKELDPITNKNKVKQELITKYYLTTVKHLNFTLNCIYQYYLNKIKNITLDMYISMQLKALNN